MNEKDKLKYNRRFSGYQLPKIQLDETGHSYYYIIGVHPYYTTQPMYWQQPYYSTSTPALGNSRSSSQQGGGDGNNITQSLSTGNNLHCMIKNF